jgi:nucleoside 2-deoxyribosyltransferase
MNLSTYLAGPITNLSYDGATNWRIKAKQYLNKFGIAGLNPLRGKDYLKEEKEIKLAYPNIPLSSARGITTRDYYDCGRSDLILVNLLGATKVSIGTVMEIAWAKAFQKPIILIIEDSGNIHDHPMITESVGFRVNNLEDALNLAVIILKEDTNI